MIYTNYKFEEAISDTYKQNQRNRIHKIHYEIRKIRYEIYKIRYKIYKIRYEIRKIHSAE